MLPKKIIMLYVHTKKAAPYIHLVWFYHNRINKRILWSYLRFETFI